MENYSKLFLCNINILFIKACELPHKSGMNVFSHNWLVIAKEEALLLTVRRVPLRRGLSKRGTSTACPSLRLIQIPLHKLCGNTFSLFLSSPVEIVWDLILKI